MKERGIIFSSDMVRAILDGRKSQTRRVIKLPKEPKEGCGLAHWDLANKPKWAKENEFAFIDMAYPTDTYPTIVKCPYGVVGDLLWVRESWVYMGDKDFQIPKAVLYKADYRYEQIGHHIKFEPSIHMPKWAARLWLEITNIRVERLKEISDHDIICEGFEIKEEFFNYIIKLNRAKNPEEFLNKWVWVIESKRKEKEKCATL